MTACCSILRPHGTYERCTAFRAEKAWVSSEIPRVCVDLSAWWTVGGTKTSVDSQTFQVIKARAKMLPLALNLQAREEGTALH